MKKADNLNRALAKIIDFLLVGALCIIPPPVGIVAGALYILISDGWQGQSVGKRLIGLRVMAKHGSGKEHPATFRDSLIRNLPYAAVVLLGSIPIVGWFIFFPLGLVLIGFEAFFAYADEHGVRIGDIFAQTQVTNDSPAGA